MHSCVTPPIGLELFLMRIDLVSICYKERAGNARVESGEQP